MMVRFVLPISWPTLAGADLSHVTCDAVTVGQALSWLVEQFPMLRERIFAEDGDIAPWVLVCLGDTDIRDLGLHMVIPAAGSELQIVPALMGG